ncbi:MAG: Thiamine pyrophosphokinase [bacterium ADurb.Bin243]|nr:MAG: Thiamine pyrophosphokinase [bacterium ADurb.Bin243]
MIGIMKCFILISSKQNAGFRKTVTASIAAARREGRRNRKPIVICADSGIHLIYPEIAADYLIGDFDSIKPQILKQAQRSAAEIIKYPAEKDFTDFHLALELAVSAKRRPSEIIVYGGLSGRLDQTLANIFTAACFSIEYKIKISLHETRTSVYLLNRHFKTLEIKENIKPGDTISLRPLFKRVKVKSGAGLKYPLKNDIINCVDTRGISNEAYERKISLEIASGELIAVHIRR